MDELVQSVSCYNPRHVLLHGYIAPFILLQAVVYYQFSGGIYDPKQEQQQSDTSSRHSFEIAVIAIAVSFVAQVVTYLFCHWSVDIKCWLSYNRCQEPANAKYVKVTPTPNNGSTELVLLRRETITKRPTIWFMFQKSKYFYDEERKKFVAVEMPCNQKLTVYREWKGFTENDDQQLAERQYGRNELDMDIPSFKQLFTERATAPFFVFQTFCVGLWCMDEFWYYAVFTLFMLVTFEVVLVKQQLRNMQEIRQMGNKPFAMQVFRQNKWKQIRSDQLVAGDLVSVTRSENNVPCDILLIRGSCIVDESTLTGESVPQMKEPIEELDLKTNDDERRLDVDQDKLHILFGGTKILQHTAPSKEPGCIGYVIRTGFYTSQGKLLRTILFGVKRVTANNMETFWFILFLLFFAMTSAYYVWTEGIKDPKKSRYRLFFECTVIVTSVVPPELPIELSLAVNSSLMSLVKLLIYCTEPFRIPFAGKVEYCCFDKTGTLTSDDLVVEGVAGVSRENSNKCDSIEPHSKEILDQQSKVKTANQKAPIVKSAIADHKLVVPVEQCPVYTQQVLASCHSLAHLDDNLVGDPLEKKVLEAVGWNYSKSGTMTPKRGRAAPLKIHSRFHFNSTLKRMSVIVSYKLDMSNENIYICTAKGAPEFMRPLLREVPEDYDKMYLEMSRLGARVLALGYKTLGSLSHQELAELKREEVEKDLLFAGFVLISCPLKPDSKEICVELESSGHRLVMITGDGALTACHVAEVLGFIKKTVLVLTKTKASESKKEVRFEDWNWVSTDQTVSIPFSDSCGNIKGFSNEFDLCLTGESIDFITREQKERLGYEIIRRAKVFARVSPKQKELIVTKLKSRGTSVLMCGDGTNDVGALKHAQVGVALLSTAGALPVRRPRIDAAAVKSVLDANSLPKPITGGGGKQSSSSKSVSNSNVKKLSQANPQQLTPRQIEDRRRAKAIESRLRELLEEQDQPQFVKLGDASIAAPFTSRLSSIQCVSHIIKQGRCTLVTTLQMFKILALNALLNAYCHSILYLEGVKFSDAQVTIQGLIGTFCFLFITRSQPLKKMSPQRPLPNIFNLYTILSVTLQFSVHFAALVYLNGQAKIFQEIVDKQANATIADTPMPVTTTPAAAIGQNSSLDLAATNLTTTEAESLDGLSSLHTEFVASLVNSTVYIIWTSVQLATFVVNYKGHPFMQDLRSNRPLCYSFIASAIMVFACVNRWSPELAEQLSVVEFPLEFRPIVLGIVVADFFLALAVDRLCEYLFGRLQLESL